MHITFPHIILHCLGEFMGLLSFVSLICITAVCFIAYSRLNAIDTGSKSRKIEINDNQRRRLSEMEVGEVVAPNPFMDAVCMDFIQDSTLDVSVSTFSVIIVARNEDKSALLKTVKSVLDNSVGTSAVGVSRKILLKSIIVVDDFSYSPVSGWGEWATLKLENPALVRALHVVRLNRHSGTAFAKNYGVSEVRKISQDADVSHHALVFLESHAIVSPYWLVPLANTLTRYPKGLVYPVIDALTGKEGSADAEEIGVVRAEDHLVAGFDWAFRPRWEKLLTHADRQNAPHLMADRVKASPYSTEDGAVEVVSPSAPSIFAVRLQYFEEIGKFDAALYSTFTSSAETVELSLRAWLCGGIILKQKCSRVAQYSANLFSDAPVGQGVTQGSIDRAVLNVAQKWLQGTVPLPEKYESEKISYYELTFRARFLNRVPYAVEVSNDPILITPPQSTLYTMASSRKNKGIDSANSKLHVCLPFQWYVQEVYPGLLVDAPSVLDKFAIYINSDYMTTQKPIQALLHEYNIPAAQQKAHVVQTGLLSVRAGKLENQAAVAVLAGDAAAAAERGGNFHVKRVYIEPPGIKPPTKAELMSQHTSQIHEEFICTDFPETNFANSCEAQLASDPEMCTTRKADLLFLCPKTCKYCAKEDGRFCEDFYLNKCVTWHANGQCGTSDAQYGTINDICRKSCGLCTPQYSNAPSKNDASIVLNVQNPKKKLDLPPPPKLPEFSDKEIQAMRIDAMIKKEMTVQDDFLQKQYSAGLVPDIVNGDGLEVIEDNQCSVDRSDGQLLSRVVVAPVSSRHSEVRIFCGIYTMEANHNTNVKATRSTWAKKCDGFIAFSTKEDSTIPSVNILHEGEEAYGNMWQKSRSIWKYVHAHLREKYDFFLLGGDDMFYIVENLRAYLGSEEMVKAREESEGLFIGRIFQPPNQIVFNSGGAGYLLDKKALEVLGSNIDSIKCYPHQVGFWEDVNVANCLKKSTPSITPFDTRDSLKRERFHPFTPGLQLTYRIPPKNPDWYAKYNPELKVGFDCCSDESISFHYVKEKLLYQLYNYLYHCNQKIQ